MLLTADTKKQLLEKYNQRCHFAFCSDDVGFTISIIDDYFQYRNLRSPDIRIARQGKPVPVSDYTVASADRSSKVVDKEKVQKLINGGCTAIFEHVNYNDKYFNSLSIEINELLNTESWINCYLTPSSSQGFDIHTDDHDVIAVQLSGNKVWYLYPEDDKVEVLEMKQGDVLYIPKGLKHKAATQSSHSLHATIGFYPLTYYSVLKEYVLSRLADYDNVIFNSKDNEQLAEVFNHISKLPRQIDIEQSAGMQQPRLLETLDTAANISSDTQFSFDTTVNIIKKEHELNIVSGKQVAVFSLDAFELIKEARMAVDFSINMLKTAVSEENKLEIVKKLYVNGLVTVSRF